MHMPESVACYHNSKTNSFSHDLVNGNENLALLTENQEIELIKQLVKYSEVVEKAALNAEPHTLVHYLRELANCFHTYYNAHQFIVDDENLRNARLNLIIATQHVVKNGLLLLGVSAPTSM